MPAANWTRPKVQADPLRKPPETDGTAGALPLPIRSGPLVRPGPKPLLTPSRPKVQFRQVLFLTVGPERAKRVGQLGFGRVGSRTVWKPSVLLLSRGQVLYRLSDSHQVYP